MKLFGEKPGLSNIHILFTCLLVAIIPFGQLLISYAMILWFASALVLMIRQKDKLSRFRFDAGLILNLLLYLAFVIGVFYSHNMASALFDIQVKMTMIMIPPVVFMLRDVYRKYSRAVLLCFVLANILASLICLGIAFDHSFQWHDAVLQFKPQIAGNYQDTSTGLPSYFTYNHLSAFKHPSYFSMYLLLCIFIIAYFWRNSFFLLKGRITGRILYAVIIAFFVLMIYLLQSKAVYLSLLLLTVIYMIAYAAAQKKWIGGIAAIAAIVIISIFGYKYNTRFFYISAAIKDQKGLTEAIKKKDYKVLNDTYAMDRLIIWMISAEIISENFWTGVGSGDVKLHLIKKYDDHKLQAFGTSRYNTHNQYLETFMSIGFIGFLVFLAWLFYPLFRRRLYNKSGFLILIFTGILIINFLFEAVLNTISGVIFAAFFYSYLLYLPADPPQAGEEAAVKKRKV